MSELLSSRELARYIDHTLLKPDATRAEIEKLCAEAREWGFHSVCVNGSRVLEAYAMLEDSGIKICTVTGFPLGAADSDSKRFETEAAVDNGADEIDVVINIGRLKDRDDAAIVRELRDVIEAADGRIVKVIIETALLTRDEKRVACELALAAEAHFIKTSTGFAGGGASVEDVRLMREIAGRNCGVKASGGIRNLSSALALLEAGATRLGLSASVALMQELKKAEGAA